MKINRGREPGTTSEQRTATFTGEVWADPVLAETEGVVVANVFFTPGAGRTGTPTSAGRPSSSRAARAEPAPVTAAAGG